MNPRLAREVACRDFPVKGWMVWLAAVCLVFLLSGVGS